MQQAHTHTYTYTHMHGIRRIGVLILVLPLTKFLTLGRPLYFTEPRFLIYTIGTIIPYAVNNKKVLTWHLLLLFLLPVPLVTEPRQGQGGGQGHCFQGGGGPQGGPV